MSKKLTFEVGKTASGTIGNLDNKKLKDIKAKEKYNFQFIPKEKIEVNNKNKKYVQEDIDSLKNSILVNGLRHNLSVIYDTDNDKFRIISGERRYNAICSFSEKQYEEMFPSGIPCKIENVDLNDVDEEIMLISANHDVREPSMEVKRWEIRRLSELYKAKKESGEIKNIAKEIANQLEISERQALKYMNAEKLVPELSDLLNSKKIKLDIASQYSSLSEDAQLEIAKLINEKGSVEDEEYQAIKEASKEQKKKLSELETKIKESENQLKSKDEIIENLQNKIDSISADLEQHNNQNNNDNDINEEKLKLVYDAKQRIEKEKSILEAKVKQLEEEKKSTKNFQYDTEQAKKIQYEAELTNLFDGINKNLSLIKKYKNKNCDQINISSNLNIVETQLKDIIKYYNA